MRITEGQLSLMGQATPVGVDARASAGLPPAPVDPADPLKDSTSAEYRQLQQLKQRDREVRQHEQAHMAAGGGHVRGGAAYSYQRGPDGRQYAVGGEVQIDTSGVADDPQATIRKMQAVQRAALAPAEPSGQDRAVAAQAAQTEASARAELQQRADGNREPPREPPPVQRLRHAEAAYRGTADTLTPSPAPLLDLIA